MVDAYGLPIDEMTRGWDQWVWPLSMNTHRLPGNVDKICHAVALDDERHTFHPVLLDEAHQPLEPHIDKETVTQVWFAGVHSNVGGGYPDDSLSRVSLRWMAEQAKKSGLRLHRFVCDEWDAHADPHGPANDSRRGLGVYYRYNPRSIQKLTDDRFAEVVIPRPKIHESVFSRIRAARDDYAPIVLPQKYAIVDKHGSIVDAVSNPYEHPTQAQSRCSDQERVWNLVWLRRVLYFTTVAVTLLIVVPPMFMTPDESPLPNPRSRALSGAIELTGKLLPESAQVFTNYYRQNPVQFAVLAVALVLLMIASSRVQRKIHDRMRALWDSIVNEPPATVQPSPGPTDPVYRFRSHPAYRTLVEVMSQRIFPFVFGVGALLLLALTVVATANRGAFAAAGAAGSTCRDVKPAIVDNGGIRIAHFSNRELCHATGIELEAGRRYQIRTELPPGGWYDSSHKVETPGGFSSTDGGPIFLVALPFRRVFTAQWFVPMARIGAHGAEYHSLDRDTVEIVPRRTNQLFLFVNDAIGLPGYWRYFYRNNCGSPLDADGNCVHDRLAKVTITRVSEAPAAAGPQ
jgi:hypothetical protein